MKKNLFTIILCAMLCVGCLFADTNEFVALAFIGFVGGVMALSDLRKPNKVNKKLNCIIEPEDEYLLDYETGLMY